MDNNKLKAWVRRISLAIVILLIVLTIVVVTIPKAIQFAAIYWLDEQGIEADITDFNIHLLRGEIELLGAKGKNQHNHGFNVDSLKINIEWEPLFDKTLRIKSINLSGLNLDIEHQNQLIHSIAGIQISQAPPAKSPDKKQDTETSMPWSIQLQDITLNSIESCNYYITANKTLCFTLDDFVWTGDFNFIADQSATQNPGTLIQLDIADIGVVDKNLNQTIFHTQVISLDNFAMQGVSDIKFDSFEIADLKILPIKKKNDNDHSHIALLDNFKISEFNLKDTRLLNIKNISAKGVGINIVKDKNSQWNVLHELSKINPYKAKTNETTSTNEVEPDDSSFSFKVDEINIVDSQPIIFRDNSLNSPYESSNVIKRLSVNKINSAKPHTLNEIKLNIITKNHGEILLEGEAQLLANLKNFNITGTAKGIDLRPVSSYIEAAIGHRVKSGQLNADIKLLSKNGVIDSLLDLDLKKFKLRSLSETERERLNKELELGVPLDVALDMLRDSDDNINIKLPITGNVDAPEFDPSDAIYTAMSKAITAAIINYYTPFGLVAVAEGLFNLATALQFDPLVFDAGVAVINATHKDEINKIVTLMTQRPKIHLTLCGQTNKSDLSTISPELFASLEEKTDKTISDASITSKLNAIASERSENVKQYFMENDITADRLILCEPEHLHEGISGVDVSL